MTRLGALAMALALAQPGDDCLPGPGTDATSPGASGSASTPAPSSSAPASGVAPGEVRRSFTVATFNTGLAPGWVKHADARRALIHEALAREPLDLLCVQEYWSTQDYVALLKATADRLPHQHRASVRRPAGVCTSESLAAIERCAIDECADGNELTDCVAGRCRESVSEAGPDCVRCLIAHSLAGEELAGCTSDGASHQRDRFPRGGVALLSAHPIVERDELPLSSPVLDRLVLHARLTETPLGTLDVFCTHLTTPLPVELPGMSPAVNRRQTKALLAFVEAKKPPGAVIVVGDLNLGPAIGEHIRGYFPEHYALLESAGFSNPYAMGSSPRCTRCDANRLVRGSGPGGILIDHILVKGHRGTVAAERFLDEPATTPTGPLPLSDHYGVRATFQRGRSP